MKTITLKSILFFIVTIIIANSNSGIAQLVWQKGGNNSSGGTQTTIGTNGFWNQPFSLITFGTTRLHINNGTGIQAGFIGIGTNFLTPQNMVHIHDGNRPARLQITNTATNNGAGDGFTLGIQNNGTALLNQQEDLPMWFNTNDTLRMAIDENGLVTINSLASCSNMLVTADSNGTLKTTETETLLAQSKTITQMQTRITELENKLSNLMAKK